MVAMGLILAVMAGAATAAAAGARRTESAFPRFLQRFQTDHASLGTAGHPDTDKIFSQVAALPSVSGWHRGSLFIAEVTTPSGAIAGFPDIFLVAENDPSYAGNVKMIQGRMADPDDPSEAVANYFIAERLDLAVGDQLGVRITSQDGQDRKVSASVTIVGIGAYVGEFETDNGAGFQTMLHVTPAFLTRYATFGDANSDEFFVSLRGGNAAVPRFAAQVAAAKLPTDGPPVPTSVRTRGTQSLNQVPVAALWMLCVFIAITTLAVFAQLFSREGRQSAPDFPALRALGVTNRQLFLAVMARHSRVVLGGALGSLAVAYALSPVAPLGLARIAEPTPGFNFDARVALLGSLVTLLTVGCAASIGAAIAVRRRSQTEAAATTSLSALANRLPLSVGMRTGLTMSLDPGQRDRAVPLRSAILGTTISIIALTAALVFTSSLRTLVETPRLSGYTYDIGLIAQSWDADSARRNTTAIQQAIAVEYPDVKTAVGTVFSTVNVAGRNVSVSSIDGVAPAMIEGVAPQGDGELALDAKTLRAIDRSVGDQIPVRANEGPKVSMRIVGTFAVPRIPFQGENPGQAAAFTRVAWERLNDSGYYADTVFVRLPPGRDLDGTKFAMQKRFKDSLAVVVTRQMGTATGNVARMSSIPLLLAIMMSVLGLATLAHALSATISRRRREIAVLKSLGFVRRQIASAVAWQSSSMVIVALAFGVPLGIAVGRWGWRLFAQQLQVVPLPTVSAAAVLGIIAGALVVGNAVAAYPARIAARTSAARVLRAE